MTKTFVRCAALALITSAGYAPAVSAQEVYGGVYAHAVETPFTFDTNEGGVDLQAGVRFGPLEALADVEPYVFGSVNLMGDTSFVGAGVSWKAELGAVYVRPGVGLVVHDAPSLRVDPETGFRTDLGSRILFEPEIAIGVDLDERWSIEASWVHISNARLFNSQQNPGIDMMGLRVNRRM